MPQSLSIALSVAPPRLLAAGMLGRLGRVSRASELEPLEELPADALDSFLFLRRPGFLWDRGDQEKVAS